jgi:hypothetical protein
MTDSKECEKCGQQFCPPYLCHRCDKAMTNFIVVDLGRRFIVNFDTRQEAMNHFNTHILKGFIIEGYTIATTGGDC